MEIMKLSEFVGKNFSEACNKLYQLTDFNNKQYPEYLKWFYGKCIPRILDNKGDVLFSLDGFMLKGLLIYKNDESEKKICTLYVDEPYRNKNLGTVLIENSISILETEQPIISIPKNNLSQFEYYINRYNWKEKKTDNNIYKSPEIFFN